jgi:hypothetical protein
MSSLPKKTDCALTEAYFVICAVDLAAPTLTVAAEVIIQMTKGAGLLATRTMGEEEVDGARREEGTSLNSLNPFPPSTLLITCSTYLTKKWAPPNRSVSRHSECLNEPY